MDGTIPLRRAGRQTAVLSAPVAVLSAACVAGKKEGEGPFGNKFDSVLDDDANGENSWEKAESAMVEDALGRAVKKAGCGAEGIDYILAGDLLNQSIGSTFGVRAVGRPFIGLFGACSTFGEALALGAMLVDGGFAGHAAVAASSHFCAAEKQFRFPLELGTQRPPTSSWTVTGCGAAVLGHGGGVCVTSATFGKVVDLGITDPNNMGAAMAPAAADTLLAYFRDVKRGPSDYDLIVTGDLGGVGSELLVDIMRNEGFDISGNHEDCGVMIFDGDRQDTHAGGSGCGCAAVSFACHYYEEMKRGRLKRILFMPTGALMSPTSAQQGESIPGIAHCVELENIQKGH